MAGNVRGITICFEGDTTKLDRALRQIEKNTRSLDKELKQVDNALKFNPTNVDLWRQKQELLTKKIDETKKRLELLKDTQRRIDSGEIEVTADEYRKLQRDIIITENQLKTFEGQLRKIGNVNLRAMSEQFRVMGDKLTSAGEAMRGLSMAAAAVTAAIGAMTVKSGKWADDINTMSKVYGISTGELQKYSAAAQLVDVDVETIAKSHTKLEKQMYSASKGTGAAAEAFEKLGVSTVDSSGELRSSDEVFQDVIAALGEMTNETERDAIAQQLMGKSAAQLNPLIEDGGKTYENLAKTLSKYDLDFIDQETLDNANAFNDSLDTIKAVGLVAFQQVGTQLAAYLAPALEKVVDLVGKLAGWFANLSPETQTLIAGIGAVVAVLAPLLIGLGKVSFAISSIMGLMATVGPAIGGVVAALGPVVVAIAAVIAIGVLLYKNWDTIKAMAIQLKNNLIATWNNIKSKVTSAVTSLKSKITSTFSAIKSSVANTWNAIKTAIVTPIEKAKTAVSNAIAKIKSVINAAKLSLPHIKLPHFSISGKFSLNPPSIPHISVSWYKQGGIFDSPSLIGIGEAGPEAVVPLDKLWEKLDKIAESSTSDNVTINVYASPGMDVNELARVIEKKLVAFQKQRQMAWQ